MNKRKNFFNIVHITTIKQNCTTKKNRKLKKTPKDQLTSQNDYSFSEFLH